MHPTILHTLKHIRCDCETRNNDALLQINKESGLSHIDLCLFLTSEIEVEKVED